MYSLGDFNVSLLNYNDHTLTNEFLDFIGSNSFIPYILQPTRKANHSETLADNIFSSVISADAISVVNFNCNLNATMLINFLYSQ